MEVARVPQERTRNDRKRKTDQLHKTKMKFQTELTAAKSANASLKESETATGESKGSAMAKLLKLVISKFGGNWQRF